MNSAWYVAYAALILCFEGTRNISAQDVTVDGTITSSTAQRHDVVKWFSEDLIRSSPVCIV